MKTFKFFSYFLVFIIPSITFAQSGITTDITAPYDDVTYLIENVLSDGNSQISNVTYSYGDVGQIGYFSDINTTSPILGYSEGIFMSTRGGTPLENNTPGISFGPNPEIIDPDLSASLQLLFGANYNMPIANFVDGGHDQNNIIIIEFDIIADESNIEFFYSFASREYKDFVCSPNFNDVFGFYVTGPNPNDPTNPYIGKNIALIPTDTTQNSFTNYPVSINSINGGFPSDPNNFNICQNANPNFQTDSNFFVDNEINNQPGPVDFHFFGYTKPLRAFLEVECFQTYHLKLAICDVSDENYGSAVMFQKESLNSECVIDFDIAPNVSPDTNGWFYEGCGTSFITFKRPNVSYLATGSGDLQVDFTLGGDAIYGVDYDFINSNWNDHIIIPNMDNEFVLEINPINDGIIEGTEDIIFIIPYLQSRACIPLYIEAHLTIADHPELTIELADELKTHCPGDEVTFELSVSGGLPITTSTPYNIHWSQIGSAYQQTVSPEVPTMYYVEVSDLCPQYEYLDSIFIDVSIWPELVIDDLEDQYICTDIAAQYDFLNNKVNGGDSVYTYSWVNLKNGSEVSTLENPFLFAGTYEVTIRDGCENQATKTVSIYLYELPDLEIVVEDQGIERTVKLSVNEYPVNTYFSSMDIDYTWDFGDGSPTITNKGPLLHQYPEFGFYTITLTATNKKGCKKVLTKSIEITPFIYIPTIFTPNGDGINEGFCAISPRLYSTFEMKIFDRWGQELFVTDNIESKWFGKNKRGIFCSEGLYVYIIKIKYLNYNDTKQHEGYVHLTR